jgi:galacturan 1,4-alpha-galacturonidase
MVIPQATFLSGPIEFKGPCPGAHPIIVEVKGKVIAPTDLSQFPSGSWISFQYIDGLILTGGGTFDGQGATAWPSNKCPKTAKCKFLPTVRWDYYL